MQKNPETSVFQFCIVISMLYELQSPTVSRYSNNYNNVHSN